MPEKSRSTLLAPSIDVLARRLRPRHIYMMSIGSAIGVGLFLGSGEAMSIAGPALLISYALVGAVVYCLMRALGEMAVHRPTCGSFSEYAHLYLGDFAGFASGWTYWLYGIAGPMAELTAAGVFMHFWFPSLPQWVPAVIGLITLYIVQWLSVRLFGEFEFWFAIVKVIAIVGLIVLGVIIVIAGWTALGSGASVSNLWTHGGFFPHGASGMFLTLPLAVFAFIGVEMIGVTAGEAADPEKTLPRAFNNTLWRILIFYIGALFVLMMVQPWTAYSANVSPFVDTLSKAGLVGAAGFVNFVVLTSALSACNGNSFGASRLLFSLANSGSAPHAIRWLSNRKVPGVAVSVSFTFIGIGVLINYVAPAQAFTYVTSVATIAGLSSWFIIALAHLGFRRTLRRTGEPIPGFHLPGAPWTALFVLAATVGVAISMGFNAGTRIGLYAGAVWAVLILITYTAKRRQMRRAPAAAEAPIMAPAERT